MKQLLILLFCLLKHSSEAFTTFSKTTLLRSHQRSENDSSVKNNNPFEHHLRTTPYYRAASLIYYKKNSEDDRRKQQRQATQPENEKPMHWNLINLMREEKNNEQNLLKRELLMKVFRQAKKNQLRDSSSVSNSNSGNDDNNNNNHVIPEHFASVRRFIHTSPFDKNHEGEFRIFGAGNSHSHYQSTTTTTIASNLVFSMDNPLSYISENLSYKSPNYEGSVICDNSETIVWCVGKDQNMEYTSRVLDDMPFSQIFLGGFEDCRLDLDSDTVAGLESLAILERDLSEKQCDENLKETGKISCILSAQDLDVIRSYIHIHSSGIQLEEEEDIRIQNTLMKLIDSAVSSVEKDFFGESTEPHLVLVANSLSASIVAGAISKWKEEKLLRSSVTKVNYLLHKALTVVTIGAVTRKFCEGPAYVHISMFDDHFARQVGVTRENPSPSDSSSSSYSSSVYFHAWSPYNAISSSDSLKSNDAHNMNACSIQFLYLIMRINGIMSFRGLYDAAKFVDPRSSLDIDPKHFAVNYSKQGDLVIPPRIDDELLPAMIIASGGDKHLWNPSLSSLCSNDQFYDCLPTSDEAKAYLEESFGYSTYEEICDTCGNLDTE